MAERIVSPGVFTNEIDASFLPAAVSEIGAAIVGVCNKGPAFVPTVVESFTDFKIQFGELDTSLYMPYAAKSYLKNAGTATIVRVLGTSGMTAAKYLVLKSAGTNGQYATASIGLGQTFVGNTAGAVGKDIAFTGSDGKTVYKFEPWSGSANGYNVDGPGSFGISNPSGATYFFQLGKFANKTGDNLAGIINSGSATHGVSATPSTGGTGATLHSTIILSASLKGTQFGNGTKIYTSSNTFYTTSVVPDTAIKDFTWGGGQATVGSGVVATIFPTSSNYSLASATLVGKSQVGDFNIRWQGTAGTTSPTMSLHSSNTSYIENVLSKDPSSTQKGYLFYVFRSFADNLAAGATLSLDVRSNYYGGQYASAKTPFINSQQIGGQVTNLFKIESLSDGVAANSSCKVAISNIKKSSNEDVTKYGTFDVIIRSYGDTDNKPQVLETYSGCNLDKDSPNFIARRIGDIKETFNTSKGKIEVSGDYKNRSKYVRVSDINSQVKSGAASPYLLPFGFKSYPYPTVHAGSDSAVPLPMVTALSESGEFNSKMFHGVAFDSSSKHDIYPYLYPSTTTAAGGTSLADTKISSSRFGLDTTVGLTTDSPLNTKRFIMGLHGGSDGWDPRVVGSLGMGNGQFGNSGANLNDFKNALATISNPDETDINMLVMPGINKTDHSKVYNKAKTIVEDRADTFMVVDPAGYNGTQTDAVAAIETEDSNFIATYYPWVKIFDDENNTFVWVPPSVVLPGVISFTDKVSHPWFAPAGLNRGGLTEAVMAKERLTQAERDYLYENRVNPIATFPGQGVCVWGQKTLQAKPSALDRINVRRLLIRLKKFIASTSKFLVFEQNNQATRNRFLNIVNPFMEQVQSKSGLTAFKIVVDESVNTPDVVDRNELRGQIFIQPTRTAEFIVLDFVVMPTGATFPE
tara:strand:- start:1137 stop:3890 length:2754 start_codon:yes stop_codon:yes gene_type:complete